MTRAATSPDAALCTVDGCTRPWSSNFGRRLCPVHAQNPPAARQRSLPTPRCEPQGWWTEAQDRPEETGTDA